MLISEDLKRMFCLFFIIDCSEDEYEMNFEWNGFKIVGDNIDKNFRRTYQRIDRQTRSCHYYHSYAVLDRV
jgi:L1 cell adhesion molecule like protein